MYVEARKQETPIVGIVDRLQVSLDAGGRVGEHVLREHHMIEPFAYVARYSHYVVRVKSGQLEAVMQAAQKKLFEVNRSVYWRKCGR